MAKWAGRILVLNLHGGALGSTDEVADRSTRD